MLLFSQRNLINYENFQNIIFKRKILVLEKVNNDHLFVLHRSPHPVEFSSMWDEGIVGKKNSSDLYGKGLYTVYSNVHDKNIYGDYILRGSVKINNYAILEKDVYDQVSKHYDGSKTFKEHLIKLGVNLREYSMEQNQEGFSSKNALKNWKKIQKMGYDGIILHGRKDGYVCVIWEQGKDTFTPHSFIHKADKLGVGKMKFKTGDEEKKLYNTILNSNQIEGTLNLKGTQIKNLGEKLHTINGDLELYQSPIESLGNLKVINGNIIIRDCENLKSLGRVEKSLGIFAQNSSISDIGNITNLEQSCNLENSNIINIDNLKSVGGYLKLKGTQIQSLKSIGRVGGFLDIRETPNLKYLGNPPNVSGKILYDVGSNTEKLLKYRGWLG